MTTDRAGAHTRYGAEAAFLATVLVFSVSVRAQSGPTLIFNGTDTSGWTVEDGRVEVREGVLAVSAASGWLRLDGPAADYILRMDVRLSSPEANAGIFVRTWPTREQGTGTPTNGYRVVLSGRAADPELPGRVIAHGRQGRERLARDVMAALASTPDRWREYRIECLGDAIRVRVDGVLVSEVSGVQNPQGFIALRTSTATAEFRNITLERIPVPPPRAPEGVLTMEAQPDLLPPKVRRQSNPRYTAEAMRRRIQGTVTLSAIVREDGSIADTTVIQSLDPEFGLDEQALDAVRRWRFDPGAQQGDAVPMLITVDMVFTLK